MENQNKSIIVRWTANGGDACKLCTKIELQKKLYGLVRDYPHKFQLLIEELAEVIKGCNSIYINLDKIWKDDYTPIAIEYWFSDGNTGITTYSKEDYIKNFFLKIFQIDEEKDSVIAIPAEYQLKYIKNSRQYRKEISRKEIHKIFNEYTTIDAMNNGIAKKIVAVNQYSKELYVNWDNKSEINSLYYKTYFDELGIEEIPIPYIHKIMWKCLKQICNIEEENE